MAVLKTALKLKLPTLWVAPPGVGKSDGVGQVSKETNHELIIFHPSVSDPTDFKGLPAQTEPTRADFLPYGELWRLIKAKVPTLAFFDDFGQATNAVQAATMQLLLAREVAGHKISPNVAFVLATNDTKHMAAVSGIIEPVKSRMGSIIHIEPHVEDVSKWALANNWPIELVAFIRAFPALLSDFKPSRELKNSPSPRSWHFVSKWLNEGVRDAEVLGGCVGTPAAAQFLTFAELYGKLPSKEEILLNPSSCRLPEGKSEISGKIAVATMLGNVMAKDNFDRCITYLARIGKAHEVMAVKDAIELAEKRKSDLDKCKDFTEWSTKNFKLLGLGN